MVVVMRFWIAIAAVAGALSGLIAWHISDFGPFEAVRFNRLETVLIGIGSFLAIMAAGALVRSESIDRRQARTVAGLERFETDLSRRVAAIETRLAEIETRSASAPTAGIEKTAGVLELPEMQPGDANSSDEEENAGSAEDKIHHLASGLRGRKSRYLEMVRNGGVSIWYQPVVALPERVTRFLEAVPVLVGNEERAIHASEWYPHVEQAGLAADLALETVNASVQLARDLKRTTPDCEVLVHLPGAALGNSASARQVDALLRANAGVSDHLVLRIEYSAMAKLSDKARDRLDRYRQDGYRLALGGSETLHAALSASEGDMFSFVMLEAGLLLAAGGPDAEALGRLRRRQASGGLRIIATHVAAEESAIDLIDADVLLAQGALFSPPRRLKPRSHHAGGAGRRAAT